MKLKKHLRNVVQSVNLNNYCFEIKIFSYEDVKEISFLAHWTKLYFLISTQKM